METDRDRAWRHAQQARTLHWSPSSSPATPPIGWISYTQEITWYDQRCWNPWAVVKIMGYERPHSRQDVRKFGHRRLSAIEISLVCGPIFSQSETPYKLKAGFRLTSSCSVIAMVSAQWQRSESDILFLSVTSSGINIVSSVTSVGVVYVQPGNITESSWFGSREEQNNTWDQLVDFLLSRCTRLSSRNTRMNSSSNPRRSVHQDSYIDNVLVQIFGRLRRKCLVGIANVRDMEVVLHLQSWYWQQLSYDDFVKKTLVAVKTT